MIPILASLVIPAIEGPVDYDFSFLFTVYGIFALIPLIIGIRWFHGGRPFSNERSYAPIQGQASLKLE